MQIKVTTESAAAARQARFGKLPERVRFEDMVEETAASPDSGLDNRYDPAGSWKYFNCLALDLGL
ncbi:hypothetical protein ACIQFU_24705 [Streptomyces sp. NPDC093065]|uniref:hypothetical protein n=1 Tax=Streptomyces TaxID=1883 RepID=UPI00167BEF67|nr:hypothetical protein [Streptomyces tendae]